MSQHHPPRLSGCRGLSLQGVGSWRNCGCVRCRGYAADLLPPTSRSLRALSTKTRAACGHGSNEAPGDASTLRG